MFWGCKGKPQEHEMEWDGLGMEHSRAARAPRGAVPVPPLSKECLASSSSAACLET